MECFLFLKQMLGGMMGAQRADCYKGLTDQQSNL